MIIDFKLASMLKEYRSLKNKQNQSTHDFCQIQFLERELFNQGVINKFELGRHNRELLSYYESVYQKNGLKMPKNIQI